MLDKYSWLVIVRCINGKRYAYAERWSHNTSLTGLFDVSKGGVKNIETVNIADSKKAALELAEFWNDCYKKNGTLFDFSKNWREF